MTTIERDADTTRQRTFDAVVLALRRQGRPSVALEERDPVYDGMEGRCLYRGPDGLKCAAGHLIPDDRYRPAMEDTAVKDRSVKRVLTALGHDIRLVAALQLAHDEAWEATESMEMEGDWLAEFLSRCTRVAAEFGLDDGAVRAPLEP